MRLHWIWLATLPGVNDRMKNSLLEHFGDPEGVFFAQAGAFSQIEGLSSEGLESLRKKDLGPAKKVMAICERKDLQILTIADAAYPSALKNISDPPIVLYYKGRLPDFDDNPVIAVVGTRRASAYGLTVAKRMGYQIAKCGGIVVSGMASGIDGMATSGALTAGGKTVGVLGSGADVVYPASNRNLFRDVENYGCLISEFAPGTPPLAYNFPKRNRIISGLSNGVLVVEAPEGSGALITARHGAEQGRDVFVVPGNIDQPGFVGSNQLLKDGAIVAASGWDVLCEYEGLYPDKIRRDTSPVHMRSYPEETVEESPVKVAQSPRLPKEKIEKKPKSDKKAIDKSQPTAYSDGNKEVPELNGPEKAIAAALQHGERLLDDVIAETGLDARTVASALTMLVIKGVVVKLPGNRLKLRN